MNRRRPRAARRLDGALLAGGALAALAAARWLPLPADDPLRTTLAALPAVAAALAAIARAARRAGARRMPPAATAAELIATALLAAAALARSRLGFALPAEAVFAGLALVLAHRVARQALALRPLLGRRVPQRPAAVFFFLPLAAYLALLPWHTEHRPPDGDEPFYLLITHSLAHDLDADLSDEYADADWRRFLDRPLEPQPGDPVGPRGERYSRHNLLLPLLLVPGYLVAGRLGALATMAALAAALAWVGLRLAHRYVPERPGAALLAWALLAFAPPLLLYSVQVWVEVPAALLGMLALDRIRAGRGAGTGGPRTWRHWVAVALPILALPLLKIRFLLLAGSLLVLAWWHSGRRLRPAAALGGALALVAAGTLLHNQLRYGNPLKIHQWAELEPGRYAAIEYLKGFAGLFFDGAFGLFACAPIWLLLVPAAALALRRGNPVALDLAVFALPTLWVVAPRSEWYGGWSPPFRYALVTLPLLALALVPLLARRRPGGAQKYRPGGAQDHRPGGAQKYRPGGAQGHRPGGAQRYRPGGAQGHRRGGAQGRRPGGARALIAALGAATLALTLIWVTVPGWTYSFADGRGWLADLVGSRLGADFARLIPSSIRTRPATWLVPLAAVVLLPLLWWRPRRLPRAPAWGVAALLLAAGAAVAAAERLPTRVVHFEDRWVTKDRGHLHPGPWVIERRRYRGGWTLIGGESVSAPVVAGGEGVALRLEAQFVRNRRAPLDLEIYAGRRLLAVWRARGDRRWSTVELGPFRWPAGEPLVIRARGPVPDRPARPNGVVLDRVELTWYR